MKKCWFLLVMLVLESSIMAQDMRLMTYNIRYATENDGDNQWDNRKEFLSAQLQFFAPDVFGIQEGLQHQVKYLDGQLDNYSFVGVGRDDGASKGEYCAIYYNTDKFQVLDHGTFWLSETPDVVSKGWDAALERICTYALFKIKSSGETFRVFNTHFDHKGILARENSASLIIKKIEEINTDKAPFFLIGDFNLNEKSAPIQLLAKHFNDSRQVSAQTPFGPFGTFTGFSYTQPVQDRIDYIFCSRDKVMVKKYAVLTDSKDHRFPSDHFPVMIVAEMKP
jgi:endonuclease/exonuclease/phosphatase family metal-dependent hydrolase